MTEVATFAGGCFWCYEPIFKSLQGVMSVKVGYSGGETNNPTYDSVSNEKTGHAEVFQIEFDNSKIKYQDLLEIFFKMHDPTTLNRQGNDVGTQYRSAVFYHKNEQKSLAEEYIKSIQKDYNNQIVTSLEKLEKFWLAEDYHQNFYNNNRDYPYCKLVIDPKLLKLQTIL